VIPVGDFTRRNTTPYVNWTLIAINAAVFLYTITLSTTPNRVLGPFAISEADLFFYHWGFLAPCFADWAGIAHEASPRAVALFCPTDGREPLTLFTSMFMHAGWGHIGFNMLFLWIFGDNVEDRLGHRRYLLFYLFCGLVAAFVQAYFTLDEVIPSVGASGAIAGIMGAYLILYPRAMVQVIILPIFFFPFVVPAVVLMLVWFLTQLFSGLAEIGQTTAGSGVAWWAHVGGFAAGAIVMILTRPRRRRLRPVGPPPPYYGP
jgi:membrane associated rhomboid family serine protease